MVDLSLLIPAFIAGLVTFLAPCTLPLVPGYLAFISGTSTDDPQALMHSRRRMVLNGLFFVIGFSIVFIVFGTLAGLLGAAIAPFRIWLTRIGGVFVIAFGLWMLGVLRLPFLQALNSEKRLFVTPSSSRPRTLNSLILGSSFGLGWTPCVGPILLSILVLASTTTTAFSGAILLFVFSLGLGIPFIVVAFAFGSAQQYLPHVSSALRWIQPFAGALLVALGILLLTNNFVLLINYGFALFGFINYEQLIYRFL